MHSVSVVSRFMNDPSKAHFSVAKRILRYLKGTKKQGIQYEKEDNCKLVGFTDSDWAGSLDDRKSTSGYIFCLGSNAISWSSKKQKSVALSSAEAEYITTTDSACEAIWLRRIHIELRHHFICDLVNKGEICIEFVSTHDQPADILTKSVTIEKFEKFKNFLKITN